MRTLKIGANVLNYVGYSVDYDENKLKELGFKSIKEYLESKYYGILLI